MASLNRVDLIGNLGKDPEIRTTQDGKSVATFSLATSDKWKDKSTGELKERTEWHRVVAFGSLADVISKYASKGSKLYVSGELRTRKWIDQAGAERFSTEVVLQGYSSQLVLLDRKGEGGAPTKSESDYGIDGRPDPDFDDGIPF